MSKITPQPKFTAYDGNGAPLSGGKLYTYEAGTTTNKVTYTDSTETTSNTNPVILDSEGRADVWLGEGGYKFVLKDASDSIVYTVDDLSGDVSNVFGAGIVTTAATIAITTAHRNKIIDCTAGLTLNLPSLATAGEGFAFVVKANGGTVIIDPNLSETINGATTYTVLDGQSVMVTSGVSDWITAFTDTGAARLGGTQTFTGVNTFNGNSDFLGDVSFSGDVRFTYDGELTIASGAITPTGVNHRVDTEAAASTDDLDTINGGIDGQILQIRSANAARSIVVKDGVGNIETQDGEDIILDITEKSVHFRYDSALLKWLVVSAPPPSSLIVQTVYAEDATVTTGTAQIPFDDTIPQNTEGLEAITIPITPTSATNKLRIRATVNVATASSNDCRIAALFQDTTANALAVGTSFDGVGNKVVSITFTHEMTAGTISATTFKVRAAGENSVATTLNGASSARKFGGVLKHTITIDEIKV